jgi:NADPH:quinone reductase-like Zn-dependent oxidoreductase
MRRLGAAAVTGHLDGEFDVIIDGVGGATFGRAIGHLRPRGVVVNIATQDEQDMVSFRAGRFDRARGARICTLNLPDDLAAQGGAAGDWAACARWPPADGSMAKLNSSAPGASPGPRSTPC